MAEPPRIPLCRRTFLVKVGFQAPFAGYPLLFLFLFLAGGALYLHVHLREVLAHPPLLPGDPLRNSWEAVSPALVRLAAWGGVGFLGALGAWGWRRFGRLGADLDRLAVWVEGPGHCGPVGPPPTLADRDVAALGGALGAAARSFRRWDDEVAARTRIVAEALDALEVDDDDRWTAGLRHLRAAHQELRDALAAVCVEEESG